MKATIERDERFTITINGVPFSSMKIVSEWEGFKKFSGPLGTMILTTDEGTLSELLGKILNDAPNEMTLVKASPDIIAEIKASTPA